MKKAAKSSASSRRVALKTTSGGATKAERIVRYVPDPKGQKRLALDRRKRLAALEASPEASSDTDNPSLDERFWARAIRPAVFPPVPIDARVVEWFMDRGGNRGSLMFDINHVLQDYIREQDRKAARKKAG